MRYYSIYIFLIIFQLVIKPAEGITSSFSTFALLKSKDIDISVTSDTSRINHLARQARMYTSKLATIEKARILLDSAAHFCKNNNLETTPILHLARAEYFFILKNYDKTSEECNKATKQLINKEDLYMLTQLNDFLGRYCIRTGYFSASIDYYNKNILLAKKNNLKGILPKTYNGLADVYLALSNKKEIIHTLELMRQSASEEKDLPFTETACNRLGLVTMNLLKDFKLANFYFQKSAQYSEQLKDTSRSFLAYNRMGWNYYLKKNYDSAVWSFKKSLSYCMPVNDNANIANTFGNLGTICRDKNEINEAKKYYEIGLKYGLKSGSWTNLTWICEDMSNMYKKIGDYKSAYGYYVLYKQYSDSVSNKSFNQGLAEARIRYETDKKGKELELLALKLNNQQMMFYWIAGSLVLLFVIVMLIYYQTRLKAKRRISEMNRKISEITQANLRQQMNPHFIFNTLNSIQYYMYQHDKLSTNNYLTKFSSLMRKILENSQHTSLPVRDELDAVQLYLELESVRFKDKFSYEIKIDEEIDTLMYKVPTMLIQPFVENSICHGLMHKEDKGFLKLELQLNNNHLTCIIEDNGIGRKAANEINSKKEKHHNSLGTQITKSRLDLVNTLYGTNLKTFYTDLADESGNPKGTRVEIQLPIMT